MIKLSVNNIRKYFGANLVLNNITFQVNDGDRLALVGRNGCGKSTILKLISQIENYDGGTIDISRGATLGYLQQIPTYVEGSLARDVLHSAFNCIYQLEKEIREVEEKMKISVEKELDKLLKQYSFMQEKYETLGGYGIEEKLSKVLIGLKFDEDFIEKPFELLSGGEKTRVILGKILLEAPEILLLDEPTNHLDMESLEWLEEYLKSYRGTVIVVSHDRYFLDNVVTRIVEIEDGESICYKGNYSTYVKEKEENMMLQFEAFKEQEKKIKAIENSIKQLLDWGNRGAGNEKFITRAQSMQKRLDKMKVIDKPKLETTNMKLNFVASDRSGRDVIKVEKLYKNFENKDLIQGGSFLVRFNERAAMIGANGSGKSTFIKMLLKEECDYRGIVDIGSNVKVGYLPQNITFQDENMTVLQCFREDIELQEGKAREYLAKFMFFGESVFKSVKTLSGGERTRLKLSKLLYEEINLLLLDEPTNHLDIESIETLENALEEFKGTIFFVSHDRYFINKISRRIISIEDKKFVNYLGNYDYYKIKHSEKIKEKFQERSQEKTIKKEKVKTEKTIDLSKKNEKLRKKLEDELNILEEELVEVIKEMNTLVDDYENINKLYCRKIDLEKEIENIMNELIQSLG